MSRVIDSSIGNQEFRVTHNQSDEQFLKAAFITSLALCIFSQTSYCPRYLNNTLFFGSLGALSVSGAKLVTFVDNPIALPLSEGSYYENLKDFLENRDAEDWSGCQGLPPDDIMEEMLKTQNYVAVLRCVWSEKDKAKKLQFLRTHVCHPILLLECALEEFTQHPCPETYLEEVAYRLYVGAFRARIDALCVSEQASQEVGDFLSTYYHTRIENLAVSSLQNAKQIFSQQKYKVDWWVKNNIIWPSPGWVFPRGLRVRYKEAARIRETAIKQLLPKITT